MNKLRFNCCNDVLNPYNSVSTFYVDDNKLNKKICVFEFINSLIQNNKPSSIREKFGHWVITQYGGAEVNYTKAEQEELWNALRLYTLKQNVNECEQDIYLKAS